MSELAAIFVAGFVSVFLLGFQSRLVNHGHFRLAAAVSFLIAQAQTGLWRHMMKPGAGWAHGLVYGAAGAAAITTAMWVHQRFLMPKKTKEPADGQH